MARTYPLEVWAMEEDGYASKGHHDTDAFLEAVAKLARDEGLMPDEYDFSPADVRREWWRNLPKGNSCYDITYRRCEGPGPGAFPVTVVYI